MRGRFFIVLVCLAGVLGACQKTRPQRPTFKNRPAETRGGERGGATRPTRAVSPPGARLPGRGGGLWPRGGEHGGGDFQRPLRGARQFFGEKQGGENEF